MLQNSKAFDGFAVANLEEARRFYGDTLGIKTSMEDEGFMTLHFAGDGQTLVYEKEDLQPANYTILNFPVDDIETTVDELVDRGVRFEKYKDLDQDDKGIARGPGPLIAWFTDPSGNILSVMQMPE